MEIKENTVYNCDCLELMKDIPDKSIDCILTDPPYLYLKNQKLDRPFDEEKYFNEVNRILKDDGFIVLFGRGSSFYRWNTILASLGFEFKEEIIWDKRINSSPMLPINRFHETISIHSKNGTINKVFIPYLEKKQYNFDSIIQDIKRIKSALNNPKNLNELLEFIKDKQIKFNKQKKGKFDITATSSKIKSGDQAIYTLRAINLGMVESSIMSVLKESYKFIHPTQKPVRLLERLLALVTKENDLVLDTFAGSCSTMVACYKMGRRYLGAELDKEYFEKGQARLDKVKQQITIFDKE